VPEQRGDRFEGHAAVDRLGGEGVAELVGMGVHAGAAQRAFDELGALTTRPWVLLSAGAGPADFQRSLTYAYRAGASGYLCGRGLYETMLPWETDPSMRANELGAAFADIWCAIPKVVFSRTLDSVQGNARLAEASVAEEAAAALDATDKDVSIGGAGLAAAAIELGLVDELRMFRNPVVVGGGTPFLPPVTDGVRLDLIGTRTFGSRVIYERYQRYGRARDESD